MEVTNDGIGLSFSGVDTINSEPITTLVTVPCHSHFRLPLFSQLNAQHPDPDLHSRIRAI